MVQSMRAALEADCRSVPSSSGADICRLDAELASCKLEFWRPLDCSESDAWAVGDAHGGYWHAAVFVRSGSGWKLDSIDGGDIR